MVLVGVKMNLQSMKNEPDASRMLHDICTYPLSKEREVGDGARVGNSKWGG